MTGIPFRRAVTAALLVSTSTLAGCATTSARPPAIAYDDPPREVAATPAAEPPRPVEIVTIPEPLPLPGQLKPMPDAPRGSEPTDPRRRVGDANAAARVQPARDGFLNAIQQYPWTDGALYQVYTAPGQVTDIALQEGEQLVGPGPVAAGDTVRWIIGDTISGAGEHRFRRIETGDVESSLGDWDQEAARAGAELKHRIADRLDEVHETGDIVLEAVMFEIVQFTDIGVGVGCESNLVGHRLSQDEIEKARRLTGDSAANIVRRLWRRRKQQHNRNEKPTAPSSPTGGRCMTISCSKAWRPVWC